MYGNGFYYMPGTDTCIKFGGFMRFAAQYVGDAAGISLGFLSEAPQARLTRDNTSDTNIRSRAVLSTDVRQQTEFGTLRTYMRFGVQITTPGQAEVGTGPGGIFFDRAFIQFAGFTAGRTQSFFDLFTYGGGMSYHTVLTTGDTGGTGVTVFAYTAQFGNGFTGTLSLENPTAHNMDPVVDVSQPGFFGLNGVVIRDGAFGGNAVGNNGFRNPDIVANLRVDQAWGFFGVSGSLHQASGAYFQTPNNVNNGHPADRLGWAAAVGGLLNLGGGDQIGANFCYSEGAAGFCTNSAGVQFYDSSSSVAAAWLTDGIFDTGTQVELTRVWSVNAGYQHIWSPRWRTSIFGGYVDVDYSDGATFLINRRLSNAASLLCTGLPTVGTTFTAVTPAVGNSCSPDFSFWEIGTRTQWNPVPQLDIGLQVIYTYIDTAFKGPGTYAPNPSRPAIGIFDDQDSVSAMFRFQRNFFP